MRTSLRFLAIALGVALLVGACANDLDRQQRVMTPRILAIVVDPPEAAPGQDVHVRVLAFDPMGRALRYTFRFCVDPGAFFGGITPDGSDGTPPPRLFCPTMITGSDLETVVPGALTQAVVDMLPMYAAQAHLDPEIVQHVIDTVGVPLEVRVAVSTADPTTGGLRELASGVKLFGLTTRTPRTTNPPFVYFAIGKSIFLGGVSSSFECTLWNGIPPVIPATPVSPDGRPKPASRVSLEPLDNPFDWEETYPFFDYSQNIVTGHEGAYYAWFATSDVHGACFPQDCHMIEQEGTQVSATALPTDPARFDSRDAMWDVPSTPGTYDFWLVVRDGHLGESACHTTIEVVAPASP